MALQKYPMMSVEDYLALDRASEVRYEYLDGHLYMLAGGSPNYSIIQGNLIAILRGLLRGGPCRVHTSDLRFHLSETRYVYPDVWVKCGPRGQGDSVRSPRVVIEVLSPGTEMKDRTKKLVAYRAYPTVEDYMLVNYQHQFIELYHRQGNEWIYSTFDAHDTVELKSLGISFPVAEVYEDVYFGDASSPEGVEDEEDNTGLDESL
ncbi:MAG TPA: Uma2 family endonuclease [Methylomirabilota bacterium]|nr:Uma2 family endonuclease [Methylomirabilota bacterium]